MNITEALATTNELENILSDPRSPIASDRRLFVCERGVYPKDSELKILLDSVTGLPYPLMPSDEEIPLNDGEVAGWHHGNHPHSHPALQTTGGKALRSSQLQLVRHDQHNHTENAYHSFEVGPWIHRDLGHQMGATLLASACCKHRLAIVCQDNALWLQPLTNDKSARLHVQASPVEIEEDDIEEFRNTMQLGDMAFDEVFTLLSLRRQRDAAVSSRNFRTGYDQTRDLFITYVLNQDLSNIKRKAINKYIDTGDSVRGHRLLARAAHELVQNVVTFNGQTLHDLYQDLHRASMLNPNMPQSAGELVKVKLGNVEKRLSLLPRFREELIRRRELAAA